MGTALNAGVAQDAFVHIIDDVTRPQPAAKLLLAVGMMNPRYVLRLVAPNQRAGGTFLHTDTAAHTQMNGLRVVAVAAVKITSLQKNGGTVAGTVHGAERDNLVYQRLRRHVSAPCVPESCSFWRRPGPGPWYSAARPRPYQASPSRSASPDSRSHGLRRCRPDRRTDNGFPP